MIQGTLKKWNDDKGYGFIRPDGKGPDVFIHVSALSNPSRRPRVGDVVHFRIVTENGKSRAADARIEGAPLTEDNPGWSLEPVGSRPAARSGKPPARFQNHRPAPASRRRSHAGRAFRNLALTLCLAAAGFAYFDKPAATFRPAPNAPPAADFRCEGKTHCSQMTSCAEATFYLRNCPGTQMDGDHDGIPCEAQHCGH